MASARKLKVSARWALTRGRDRKALPFLLELDDRFPADPWVLTALAKVHRRMALPERGLGYMERLRALKSTKDATALTAQLEADLEVHLRNRARFANIEGRLDDAVDIALSAAAGTEPETWTMRVLIDSAIAADRRADARSAVERVRSLRPDDATLAELERKLHA